MNLETKITIYKFTPQVFTLTLADLYFLYRLQVLLYRFSLLFAELDFRIISFYNKEIKEELLVIIVIGNRMGCTVSLSSCF